LLEISRYRSVKWRSSARLRSGLESCTPPWPA
jgi:hypothetical protein